MSHNVSCITQLIVLINRLNDLNQDILHTQTTKVSHLKKDTVYMYGHYLLFRGADTSVLPPTPVYASVSGRGSPNVVHSKSGTHLTQRWSRACLYYMGRFYVGSKCTRKAILERVVSVHFTWGQGALIKRSLRL